MLVVAHPGSACATHLASFLNPREMFSGTGMQQTHGHQFNQSTPHTQATTPTSYAQPSSAQEISQPQYSARQPQHQPTSDHQPQPHSHSSAQSQPHAYAGSMSAVHSQQQQAVQAASSQTAVQHLPAAPSDYVSLCTQHVGIGEGGRTPMVARVSICDFKGDVMIDTFIRPTHEVVDYRTQLTGLESRHLVDAIPFSVAQERVAGLLHGKIVIGHQLWFDFAVLNISHLAIDTRDVALFMPFRAALNLPPDDIIPLQTLVWRLMRRRMGTGYQHPVENARAAADLFRSHIQEWENHILTGLWPCSLPPPAYAPFFL
ncbi:ribonuclease H-like domain-containing protein [Auriculariales sp. MPI-PUGE-AT-0066]|nr:ribonuclease H-like domain-containing protein [Auriculariales sp. MPI-PUGE-AT-0066]